MSLTFPNILGFGEITYLGNEIVVLCMFASLHDADNSGLAKMATVLLYRGGNTVI